MARGSPRLPLHPGHGVPVHGHRHRVRRLHVQHRGDDEQEAHHRALGRGEAGEGGTGNSHLERDGGESDADGPGQQRPRDPAGHHRGHHAPRLHQHRGCPGHLHHHRQRSLQPAHHHGHLRGDGALPQRQADQGVRSVSADQRVVDLGVPVDAAGGQVHITWSY